MRHLSSWLRLSPSPACPFRRVASRASRAAKARREAGQPRARRISCCGCCTRPPLPRRPQVRLSPLRRSHQPRPDGKCAWRVAAHRGIPPPATSPGARHRSGPRSTWVSCAEPTSPRGNEVGESASQALSASGFESSLGRRPQRAEARLGIWPSLPRLAGFAVRASHGCRDIGDEHIAAPAAVAGPVDRASRLADPPGGVVRAPRCRGLCGAGSTSRSRMRRVLLLGARLGALPRRSRPHHMLQDSSDGQRFRFSRAKISARPSAGLLRRPGAPFGEARSVSLGRGSALPPRPAAGRRCHAGRGRLR